MDHLVPRVVRRFLAELARRPKGVTFPGMATIGEVQLAKEALKAQLGHPSWLRGIGIGGEAGNYCVKVNVEALTEEVKAAVPAAVKGVPVMVQPVGRILPLRR